MAEKSPIGRSDRKMRPAINLFDRHLHLKHSFEHTCGTLNCVRGQV